MRITALSRQNRALLGGIVILLFLSGCDTAYRYFLFPPSQPEFTLEPDMEAMRAFNDSSYSISRDGQSVIFDRKAYKIEIKYMSDFQLNNVEFADDSKDAEFSANPFTYANWIDPKLGYTPNRFSVFKISIFNYTGAKLNFDPENSFLVSDRGDLFTGYGREEKTSRNQSMELYYKRRKGSSGSEDEIFERRMGIVRNIMLYLGRPIYSGDSREGLVVYDPLDDAVQQVKLVFKDFIIGYNENNEPGDFLTMQFYFKRVPVRRDLLAASMRKADTTGTTAGPRNTTIHMVRHRTFEEVRSGERENREFAQNALSSISRFLKDSLQINAEILEAPPNNPDLGRSPVIFLLTGPGEPIFSEEETKNLVEYVRGGGFVFIDNGVFTTKYLYKEKMQGFLENLGTTVDAQAKLKPIPSDHEIYRSWRKLTSLPEGQDDREQLPTRQTELMGLFLKDRIVGIISAKAYSSIWDQQQIQKNGPQYTLIANIIEYAMAQRSK